MTPWEEKEELQEYVTFKSQTRKTMFHCKNVKFDRPSLAMTEFAVDYLRELAPRELGRIDMYWASSMVHKSYISPCTLVVALMYARRLKLKNSQYLDSIHSSNLLLVSMMVASKFLVEVDETTLEEWMKASNMDSDDLYELERNFLKAIDWNLFVSNEEFWLFLFQLEQKIAWRQYISRDETFFTYTDLQVLSRSIDGSVQSAFVQIYRDVIKVFLACTLSYAIGLLSIASVPFLLTTFPEARLGNDLQLNSDDLQLHTNDLDVNDLLLNINVHPLVSASVPTVNDMAILLDYRDEIGTHLGKIYFLSQIEDSSCNANLSFASNTGIPSVGSVGRCGILNGCSCRAREVRSGESQVLSLNNVDDFYSNENSFKNHDKIVSSVPCLTTCLFNVTLVQSPILSLL